MASELGRRIAGYFFEYSPGPCRGSENPREAAISVTLRELVRRKSLAFVILRLLRYS